MSAAFQVDVSQRGGVDQERVPPHLSVEDPCTGPARPAARRSARRTRAREGARSEPAGGAQGESCAQRAGATEAAGKAGGAGSKKRERALAAQDWGDLATFRRPFSEAWLALLGAPLPDDVVKRALARLHIDVLPHLTRPLLLADALSGAYARGGVVSVLALSSLFLLIQQHNLEYAAFYEQLYALLTPGVMQVRYRGRLLRLVDACLKSPLLPAYLIAAFAKRLARVALASPAPGAAAALPIIYNLLRRHPACLVLIHRALPVADPDVEADADVDADADADAGADAEADANADAAPRGLAGDPYRADERDPAKADALRSSLWEVQALRRHYCPAIAKVAGVFLDPITRHRPELSLAEALQASGTLPAGPRAPRPAPPAPAAGPARLAPDRCSLLPAQVSVSSLVEEQAAKKAKGGQVP